MEQKIDRMTFTNADGTVYTDRDFDELKERLNTYEEMLDNKELIILPCKIGDAVYCLRDYYGYIKPMRGIVSEMFFTKKHETLYCSKVNRARNFRRYSFYNKNRR